MSWIAPLAAPLGFYLTIVAAMTSYRVIPWLGGADPIHDIAAGMALTTLQPVTMLGFLVLWPLAGLRSLSWAVWAMAALASLALVCILAFIPPETPLMPPPVSIQTWRLANVALHVLVQVLLWHWCFLAPGWPAVRVRVVVAIVPLMIAVAIGVHGVTILGEYVHCNLIPTRPSPSLSDGSASACVRAGIGWVYALGGAATLAITAGLALLRQRRVG